MAISHFYAGFFKSLANKEINLTSDTLKVLLCESAYTPDQDNHRYKSDLSHEVTGTGYTAGGATVASVAVSYDAGTKRVSFTGAAASWPSSTILARYAILYDSTPSTDATRPLIGYVDFGGDIGSTAATYAVSWSADGIGYVTVS